MDAGIRCGAQFFFQPGVTGSTMHDRTHVTAASAATDANVCLGRKPQGTWQRMLTLTSQ